MLGRIIKRPAVHIGCGPLLTDNPPHLSLFYFPRARASRAGISTVSTGLADFCQAEAYKASPPCLSGICSIA
jgi:hypothetical protein